jgi:hypothetical protein
MTIELVRRGWRLAGFSSSVDSPYTAKIAITETSFGKRNGSGQARECHGRKLRFLDDR